MGLILFPVLLLTPIQTVESRVNVGEQILVFKWAWAQALFGNWEDGLSPSWWTGTRYGFFVRNPVSNMRFWPIVSTLPSTGVKHVGTAAEVPADGTSGWFMAWQGGYVGFRWECASWGIWIGWKVNPRDALPDAPRDYRYSGLGTACQLLHF